MYVQHMELMRARDGARQRLIGLLQEKERLFQMTQPGAIRYDKVKVLSSNTASPLEEYVTRMERLNPQIDRAQQMLEQWDMAVDEHLREMRKSRDVLDVIYVAWKVDHRSVQQIARKVNYSVPHVYYLRKKIEKAEELIKNHKEQ